MTECIWFQEEFTDCSISVCPNKECRTNLADHVPYICNKLRMDIRRHIQKYYQVTGHTLLLHISNSLTSTCQHVKRTRNTVLFQYSILFYLCTNKLLYFITTCDTEYIALWNKEISIKYTLCKKKKSVPFYVCPFCSHQFFFLMIKTEFETQQCLGELKSWGNTCIKNMGIFSSLNTLKWFHYVFNLPKCVFVCVC